MESPISTPPTSAASAARPTRWWARPITLSVVVHGVALGLWIVLAAPTAVVEREVTPTMSVSLPIRHLEPAPEPIVEELAAIDVVEHAEPFETPEELVPEDVLPEPSEMSPLVARPDRTLRITSSMFRRRAPEPAQQPKPIEAQPVVVPTPVAAPVPKPRPARAAQPALRTVSVPPVLRYYPESLRRRGIEGQVVVRVTVGARGRVVDAQVATSSGYIALDSAALRMVRDTRFAAPGQTRVGRLPVRFRLR